MKSWWRGSQKIDGSPPASWSSTTTGLPKCSRAGPPKLGAAATLSATSPVAAAIHATRRLDIPSSLALSNGAHFAGPGPNPAFWGVRIGLPLPKSISYGWDVSSCHATGRGAAGTAGAPAGGTAARAHPQRAAPALVAGAALRGHLLRALLAGPQRRAGGRAPGTPPRRRPDQRRAPAPHRRRALRQRIRSQPRRPGLHLQLLLRDAPLRRDDRRHGVALPPPPAALPVVAHRVDGEHRRRAAGLLALCAGAAADAHRPRFRRHGRELPHLGLVVLERGGLRVQPVRRDAFAAHRLGTLVVDRRVLSHPPLVDPDARGPLPAVHVVRDRRYGEPLPARRGRWRRRRGCRLPRRAAAVGAVAIRAAAGDIGRCARAGTTTAGSGEEHAFIDGARASRRPSV